MELYQLFGFGLAVAIVVMALATFRLTGLRKSLGVRGTLLNTRDIDVVRNAKDYDPQEVRLVRTSWLAAAALLCLLLSVMHTLPPEVLAELKASAER